MRVLKPDQLVPGMRLVRPVQDTTGNTLLPSGMTLSAEAIARLRARIVAEICVDDGGPTAALSTSEQQAADSKIDAEIDAMFSEVRQHPVMEAICAAAKAVLKPQQGA